MSDIVLINPPVISSEYKWELKLGSRLPPMGLIFLAAYLREKNVSVKILGAYNLGLDSKTIIDYIKKESPAYVGFTATSSIIFFAAKLATEIKKLFPNITIIIGGSHFSALPVETFERFPDFDVGVYGEGEKTLYEIISKGTIDETISSIVFRKNGTVVVTSPREYIKDLDELPFPAYDLLSNFPDFYRPTINNFTYSPVAPIISSRGCPYSCSFCTQSVFGHKLRSFSNDYVVSMLKELQKRYKIKEFCFYDDIFLLNKKRLYEFIQKVKDNNMKFSWSCEGRVDQLDEDSLREMKKAGCWQISYGVESGSQEILDYFNKKINIDLIRDTFLATARANIKARAYLIIGSPLETKETLEKTKRLVLDLPVTDIHVSFFTPLPGSKVYKDIIGNDKIIDLNKLDVYSINYVPPGMTEESLSDYMHHLYREFYFHPKRLLRYSLMLFNPYKSLDLAKSAYEFIKAIF